MGQAAEMMAWRSLSGGHCVAVCVATILEFGESAADRLAVFPESFIWEAESMARYSNLVEQQFGHWLRQLQAPVHGRWIAALASPEESDRPGHAVVARGRTVIYDPVDPECSGKDSSWWGKTLPPHFEPRYSYSTALMGGFELVKAAPLP
jgi:hypothetical protein